MERFDHREPDDIDEQVKETQKEVPPGWRPSPETIGAMTEHQEPPDGSEWEDRGIQDVPLDQIDLTDSHVRGAEDFTKVSHKDVVEAFRKLEAEVRPAVQHGGDADHFRQLDEARGVDYEHGCERVYDAFYGSDAIRLNKTDERYEVVNGYHRLAVAEEVGLDMVPAQVIERRQRRGA